MSRRRRSAIAIRPEVLEARALLSADAPLVGPIAPSPSASEILVRFAPGSSAKSIGSDLASVRGTLLRTGSDGTSTVALAPSEGVSAALATLKADASVAFAQADSSLHVEAATPNDPDFSQQWGLYNPNNVDVDALQAWDVTTGSPSTIVAVIDSGIDTTNVDFAGRLWTDPSEPAGSPYQAGAHGWNFVDGNSNVTDQYGHGTHVAGIIAADMNNAAGISGLAPNVQLMILKFIDQDGNGDTDEAVSAIDYAVDHGAKVINASWGGQDQSPALDNAIAYADSKGVVFVTAAGNDGTNNDAPPVPNYPALDRLPNLISVAAVDEDGNLADYSNYGAKTVDLAAPGSDITSIVPRSVSRNGLATYSGTSMATAYVTATVALVASVHPTWTATDLVAQVVDNTKALPSLAGKTVSGGMVDAYDALVGTTNTALNPTASSTATTSTSGTRSASKEALVHATILASDEYYAAQGSTAAGFVEGLYGSLLGRAADAGGLSYWVGQLGAGVGRYSVASSIATSVEAGEYEVAEWFITDLGRSDSPQALESAPIIVQWGTAIADGAVTDDAIHALILGSDEYAADHAQNAAWEVSALYSDVLDRPIDYSGASYWYTQLVSGRTLPQVAAGILSSPEAREVEVARWYQSDLGRSSTVAALLNDSGVQYWSGQF